LATIGRDAFPSHEELITLAAAAGVTTRIGLMTDILLATTRHPILLAKQAASLDQISGGRFVLGIGVGDREEDFTVTGSDLHTRGRRLDEDLELMHRAWRGEKVNGSSWPVTPRPVNGHSVPIMFGGHTDRPIARVAKYGIGYALGGGTPESLKAMMAKVNAAWEAAGREGKPEFRALTYFAIGGDAAAVGEANINAYYGEYGPRVWQRVLKTAAEAEERAQAFEAVGCDELLIFMTAPGLEQVERLAEAVLPA
jgi:alkanesulfonate monooxygenase SsuD/methylene tetrahydromethanopterin reductase-like flavin-dependent oxidoreductase (luciferase family)